MTISAKPLNEMSNQALHVITKEVGVADTMQFLGQFSTGTGNYTEERAALFDHLSLDEVLSEIRAKSAKPPLQQSVQREIPAGDFRGSRWVSKFAVSV